MPLVSFYTLWKDEKTEVFSCLEGVYIERPVVWNGLICFHNIFEVVCKLGCEKNLKRFWN